MLKLGCHRESSEFISLLGGETEQPALKEVMLFPTHRVTYKLTLEQISNKAALGPPPVEV